MKSHFGKEKIGYLTYPKLLELVMPELDKGTISKLIGSKNMSGYNQYKARNHEKVNSNPLSEIPCPQPRNNLVHQKSHPFYKNDSKGKI